MPIYDDYLSDASLTTESDSEDEEEQLYDERDQEYWNIEAFLDNYGPPPAIDYVSTLGAVTLYGCVTDPVRTDIASVVPLSHIKTWKSYWSGRPEEVCSTSFSHDEWDNMGRWAMQLCECCIEQPTMIQIRSCMIRLLDYGKFIRPPADRAVLPRARRRR
jgi:hypothetical protein